MDNKLNTLPLSILKQAQEVNYALTNYAVYSTPHNRDRALEQISQLIDLVNDAIDAIGEEEMKTKEPGMRKGE